MKVLHKISDILDNICGVLIVFMIGAMVILTTAQIIFRTWFTSLSWSEEATRYLLIWSTFLGATCVYRHSGNIAITFVQDLFPEKAGNRSCTKDGDSHSRENEVCVYGCADQHGDLHRPLTGSAAG